MHHSLGLFRLYSRYREWALRYYIFQAGWTKIPLVGRLVRWVANLYGKKASSACLLTLDEAEEIYQNARTLAETIRPSWCRTWIGSSGVSNSVNTVRNCPSAR